MLNFNEIAGEPIRLFGSEKPVFYLDTTDINMIKKMAKLGERLPNLKLDDIEDEIERFEVIEKEVDYISKEIDASFGEGVSKIAMRGTKSLEQLALFLNFITTATKTERDKLTKKYTKNREQKRAIKKGVM